MKMTNWTSTARRLQTERLARPLWVAAAASYVLLAGCGGPDYKLVPVSGKVTLNGKPVPEAHVSFEPRAVGPGCYARTDAEGRFTMQSVLDDKPGAVPGTHVVRITTARSGNPNDDAAEMVGEVAPQRFLDGSESFDVPAGGTDQADFELGTP
jgi:hypothetical protein